MDMRNLCNEMQIALHYASVKVYNNFIKRCIIENSDSERRYELLNNILTQVVVPDQIFKWIAEYDIDQPFEILELVMDKKLELDQFIQNVVTTCKNEGYISISIKQLNDVVLKIDPLIKVSLKTYLYELLLDEGYYPYLYSEDKLFPLQNISNNYKSIVSRFDEAITKAAYYARSRTLCKLHTIQESKKLNWKFQPSTNTHHASVLKWVEDNVKRGRRNSEARLGWSCGPDSAPWPSIHLHDYNKTLYILIDIRE